MGNLLARDEDGHSDYRHPNVCGFGAARYFCVGIDIRQVLNGEVLT